MPVYGELIVHRDNDTTDIVGLRKVTLSRDGKRKNCTSPAEAGWHMNRAPRKTPQIRFGGCHDPLLGVRAFCNGILAVCNGIAEGVQTP